MTTQIRSVVTLSENYRNILRHLKARAGKRLRLLLGELPEGENPAEGLPADPTDVANLRKAYPDADLREQLIQVIGDEKTVGTESDLQALARQADLVYLARRTAKTRYASRLQRRLAAASRLAAHAGEDGHWQLAEEAEVASVIKRGKTT